MDLLQGIDPSLFPVLKTRRALIIVDAQNDFLSVEGNLYVDTPKDLTGRIVRLVQGFRPYGDIVWIRSEYSQPRPPKSEQIITSDLSTGISHRASTSRRRRPPTSGSDPPVSRCPEAFLSGPAPGRPDCVRKDSTGAQFPVVIQELVGKKDMSFVKTHYSAFQIPDLIQRLRMKFVSEVFICGSLSNMGIIATAIDAGSHGLDIGIVEDCCGRRDSERHSAALARIQKMTGCEILTTDNVLNLLKPKPKVRQLAAPIPNPTGRRYPVVYEGPSGGSRDSTEAGEPATPSAPSSLDSSMAKMSLADEAESNLPPITFTRAGVAARGRPSRLLPDIERQLGERFNIQGGMNASPNDDLNADSGDESPDEGPIKTSSAAQPQAGAEARRQENLLEQLKGFVDSGGRKEKADSASIIRPGLDDRATEPTAESFTSLRDSPGSLDQANEPIKAMPDPNDPGSAPKSGNCLPESSSKSEDNAAMESHMAMSESEPLCEGDTKVVYDVLPQPLSDNIFDKVRDEVDWKRMSHQGGEVPRLVAVQGDVDIEGNMPVYRHPADESPPLLMWTPTVREIKDVVEKKVGHALNHALIQFYRDGNDYISEHSDKTLDITKGSFIVNVSLGAERTMVLRTKRQPKSKEGTRTDPAADTTKRDVQRARLPHNSMCRMGLQTNMRWLHAIRQDKRLDRDKTVEELAYGGARISLTFRLIGTFLDCDQKLIWGQGAEAKSKDEAHEVVNGQTPEAVKMLQAFGRENQSTEFDWEQYYGQGFDVLHISAAPRLFTSSDPVANMRVQLMLAELAVGHAKGSSAPVSTSQNPIQEHRALGDPPIKLVDNDQAKSTVYGDAAIILYLDRYYAQHDQGSTAKTVAARGFTRFQEALALGERGLTRQHMIIKKYLDPWEIYAGEADFIAGPSIGIADFAFWPVLYDIVDGSWTILGYPNLQAYFARIRNRDAVVKVFGKEKEATAETAPTSDGQAIRGASRQSKLPGYIPLRAEALSLSMVGPPPGWTTEKVDAARKRALDAEE